MSLVAYDASSDEEENSDVEENKSSDILSNEISQDDITSGNISDEEEAFNVDEIDNLVPIKVNDKKINLPLPKSLNGHVNEPDENANLSIHMKLPTPKTLSTDNNVRIIEEEDEFLHKKAEKPLIEKPPPPKKQPVKIIVPSLSQFMDFKVENKKNNISVQKNSLNLLAMLPQPKNEEIFKTKNSENCKKPKNSVTSLIPDHVKNRMQQTAKKGPSTSNQKQGKSHKSLVNVSDSEESEDENEDFFSLNTENVLPEVSESEIKAMVEKKVAEINGISKKLEKVKPIEKDSKKNVAVEELEPTAVDKVALQALVGTSHAKRRKLVEEIQVVDLSSEQILPSRDEWMRAALAAETTYQPKGVLVDEEPAPGTRKKHQITYLAHQAKANEAELQAMWAANRQNRRATASKYGF